MTEPQTDVDKLVKVLGDIHLKKESPFKTWIPIASAVLAMCVVFGTPVYAQFSGRLVDQAKFELLEKRVTKMEDRMERIEISLSSIDKQTGVIATSVNALWRWIDASGVNSDGSPRKH